MLEIGLDVADELERIFADAIALVDEREDRHPPPLADLEELARSFFDAARLSSSITALSAATSVRYVSSEKSSWPGVSSRLTWYPSYSNCMTLDVTEIPRSCSSFIQSDVA